MSSVSTKPVQPSKNQKELLELFESITPGTTIYWYPNGDKKADPAPAILTAKIASTGAASMCVFMHGGPEQKNGVYPAGSPKMDNVNIRRNGGWGLREA